MTDQIRFIGGPMDGHRAYLSTTPRTIAIGKDAYERIDDPATGEFLGGYAAVDPKSPEPPTLIIPTKRCWGWWARQPHPPHLVGNIPNVKRCPGLKPRRTR